MSDTRAAVSPGGSKHEYLLGLLKDAGYAAFFAEEEDVKSADFYIAPKIKDPASLKARGTVPFGYFGREDFKRANGVLTAEAALAVAEASCPFSIYGADVLVVGYGCIGKPLSQKLRALGAHVTVAARSEADRKAAAACSYGSDTVPPKLGGYGIVFNTVPFPVLDGAALSDAPCAAVIELASPPGGIAGECRKLVKAPGLPGKYMPETAAKVIFDSFLSFVKEGAYDG